MAPFRSGRVVQRISIGAHAAAGPALAAACAIPVTSPRRSSALPPEAIGERLQLTQPPEESGEEEAERRESLPIAIEPEQFGAPRGLPAPKSRTQPRRQRNRRLRSANQALLKRQRRTPP